MIYRTLGKTGLKISQLGYGASSLGSVFRDVVEDDGIRTVRLALDAGINFIDVAPFYGMTRAEAVLGKALRGIDRDRYVLATKVGRYGSEPKDFDFSAGRVTASVDESLARLGAGHIDIIQCHDIEFADLDQIVTETLPALRKLQQAGKVRFVGITGLPMKIFPAVIEKAEVDTIISYCHYTLNDTALLDLLPMLEHRRIGIINAAPLAMGLLTHRPPPRWHPAPPQLLQCCAQAAAHCKSKEASLEKLGLQFAVAQPHIATTVVGTADPSEMRENIDAIDQSIDPQLLAEVLAILGPVHNLSWTSGRPENN